MKVLVANSRKMRSIYENERKSDGRDAEQLARIARVDPKLLHPIEHGSQEDCGWNKYGAQGCCWRFERKDLHPDPRRSQENVPLPRAQTTATAKSST